MIAEKIPLLPPLAKRDVNPDRVDPKNVFWARLVPTPVLMTLIAPIPGAHTSNGNRFARQ
jgi:hypothetical protein